KSAQIREILISESAWEEMTCLFAPSLAHLKKQIHYNRVMYIAVLHLRHLPHRLIIFIYDHKDIFYVPQKVITHEYINHDHCVYSFILWGSFCSVQ
ncbi:hypothetical protein AWS41_00340, partial [Enterobacter hormaechei subsp. xiangfangensis]